jgi:hypothetical protein
MHDTQFRALPAMCEYLTRGLWSVEVAGDFEVLPRPRLPKTIVASSNQQRRWRMPRCNWPVSKGIEVSFQAPVFDQRFLRSFR